MQPTEKQEAELPKYDSEIKSLFDTPQSYSVKCNFYDADLNIFKNSSVWRRFIFSIDFYFILSLSDHSMYAWKIKVCSAYIRFLYVT